MTNLESILKSRDIALPTKIHIVKPVVSPVVTYSCESWTIMKAEHQRIEGIWTVVLQKTPESPLDCKEIKAVSLKGDQPWILIGKTDSEAKAPVIWSSDVNSQLSRKSPEAGKDWGQKEKRASEDEMASWHHWCNGLAFGQTLGDAEGWGDLDFCSL